MVAKGAMQEEIDACVSAQCTQLRPHDAASESQELSCLPIPSNEERRRSSQMSYKKLYRQIALGYGQGHGAYYQPWLRIRRKNTSPKSNQVVAWLPPLRREAHFFSRGEYHTALLLLWLQVQDLREQYPIWPVPHPHPLSGAPNVNDTQLPWSKGLLAIAKAAGIDHGVEVGTRQPYVATMDLVATAEVNGKIRLFTFSSKPIVDPSEEIKWRTLERLELERRYVQEIGGKHVITTSALIPIRVAGHLEWWLDGVCHGGQDALQAKADHFAAHVEMCAEHLSMAEAVRGAAQEVSIDLDSAWLLFRHCGWTQKIDIDPTQPLLTSYPIQRGGRALRSVIRRRLFDGDWQ